MWCYSKSQARWVYAQVRKLTADSTCRVGVVTKIDCSEDSLFETAGIMKRPESRLEGLDDIAAPLDLTGVLIPEAAARDSIYVGLERSDPPKLS